MGPDPRRPEGRDGVAPSGWPTAVRPPGVPGWEATAVGWLLDLGPAPWRQDPVLRRQPQVLALFVRRYVHAQVSAARALWRDGDALVTDLAVGPGVGDGTAAGSAATTVSPDLGQVRAVLAREGPRLARTAEQVDMVADALRGGRWVPRL